VIQYSIVTEQPDNEPITLQTAKTHLEYTGTAKDSYIQLLITTARQVCEKYTGLSFVTKQREVKLDRFPCDKIYIELPYGPVQSIESFTYDNQDGTTTTLVEDTDFKVDYHNRLCRVFPISGGTISSWPSDYKCLPNPISIVYQAGYDDVSGQATPHQAKTGILRVVSRLLEGRGDEGGKDAILDWETQTMLDDIKVNWNANVD
jgi:uncharacterized phiE125 gp8 family phage protein